MNDTETLVIEDIRKRQQVGIAKYGTTVAQNPLTHAQWLQHAYEEALDMAIYLKRAMQASGSSPTCWCETCRPVTLGDMRMVVCPECGNKRCPKATHHDNACTNSNEIGQKGSSWEHVK